jgi:hypothetical protein
VPASALPNFILVARIFRKGGADKHQSAQTIAQLALQNFLATVFLGDFLHQSIHLLFAHLRVIFCVAERGDNAQALRNRAAKNLAVAEFLGHGLQHLLDSLFLYPVLLDIRQLFFQLLDFRFESFDFILHRLAQDLGEFLHGIFASIEFVAELLASCRADLDDARLNRLEVSHDYFSVGS